MTNFTRQPDVLPAVLPKGTRTNGGFFAQAAITLINGCYRGMWASRKGEPCEGTAHPCIIDWTSVEATPETEAPKLCPLSGDGRHQVDLLTERCCYCRRSAESVLEQERFQLTATPDRPIQAGDWVECVDANGGKQQLAVGSRYQVERVLVTEDPKRPHLVLADIDETPAFGWNSRRFKRVDGPRPAKEALCQACEQPAGYCAENCPTRPRDEPACSECKAPAALDPDCGMCAYCVTSTGHGDETQAAQDRIMRFSTDTHHGAEARQRLAATERKERPRVTATSRMLAAGHPVGWPSNEGEE